MPTLSDRWSKLSPAPAAPPNGTSDVETPDLSIWQVYRPVLAGHGRRIALMALSSFAAGIAEALLLVMIASIAIAVGTRGKGGSSVLGASLGPLTDLHLTLRSSFILALALGFARLLFQLLSVHLVARMTSDLTCSIRASTFADFASASWSEQAKRAEADIQDLLLRHVNRTTSSISVLATAITTVCTTVALLGSALVIDPVAAMLIIVAGGILFLLIRPLTRLAKRVAREQQATGLAYGRRSLEAIGTSLEIRAFGVTKPVIERLATATEAEAKPIYLAAVLRQVVTSLYQMVTILLLLGGLFAVYSFLDRPLASLGAIVVILVRALNQTGGLQSSYHSMSEAAPFVERLNEERETFRQSRPHSGNRTVTEPSRLCFEGIDYAYLPGRNAIIDVGFEVQAGEAIGVIGPSGSGKSTLIQLLLRLREPEAGRFLVDTVDARDIDDESWFSQIAFVPQDSHLIDDTVANNIRFYRDATDADVVAAARRAHIHDEILEMPDGYDTILGSRGGAISGGQRQRMSIARALMRRPSILVLDEPTSALDMRSESLVHETFTELKGSVTIFAIAHRLSTLNTCDRIMVMSGGRLQAFGSRPELERNSEFYREALELSHIRS